MRRLPPEPQVGDRITAELVRELIRCIRERQLLKGPNYTISTGPNGTYLKLDLPKRQNFPREPLPFEVRFDATLDSGDGGWKIYLPTEHLLSYDGEDIDTSDIDGVTAIEDANGDATGWYSFDDVDLQAEHVWLVVTITDPASGSSSPTVEAEFAASEGQASTGEKVVNVCIAEISYTASSQSGDPATIEIKQSVVGALALGGTGSGATPIVPDDVSTEFIPDPPAGTQPDGDEGELQIKGFKSGQPADTNTIADYLMGTAQITGQVWLLVRGQSSGGAPVIGYLPLSAIWGDGSSGGLPLPEVTYLDDVVWDPSNHKLVKQWVKKNIVTGVETPVQGAPQGKTATINTTPISSIIGNS